MPYAVRLSRQSERYLRRQDRRAQERIVARLEQIKDDPFGSYTKPLSGLPGRRAARVGGWRIVFAVDQQTQLIDVSDIGPRGQVYRGL